MNVHGHEAVKFDCYGQHAGHYHVQVGQWRRRHVNILRLPEPTREAQIERAIFELRNNVRWYLDQHPLRNVRKIELDRDRLHDATVQAHDLLHSYLEKGEDSG
ncbi:MAG: hypothetical protein OEQ18_06385 [Gammaproteobacteria bacterium]|nr:hypothetical protein [Gammaproteobacteria bacterium]